MMVRWSWLSLPLLTAIAACNSIIGFNDLQKVDDTTTKDGGTVTTATTPTTTTAPTTTTTTPLPTTSCNTAGTWSTPVLLASVSSQDFERAATLTSDELTMIFERGSSSSPVSSIFVAHRTVITDSFGTATLVAELGQNNQFEPALSADGLTLVWSQLVGGSNGTFDLFTGTRTAVTGTFANIRALTSVNASNVDDETPFVAATGELFFTSKRTNNSYQIWRSTLVGADFGAPAIVSELAGAVGGSVGNVVLGPDGLALYFSSNKAGGQGNDDIWVARRTSPTTPFGAPTVVPELSSTAVDQAGWISPDNCRMYLSSDRAGGGDLYISTRPKP